MKSSAARSWVETSVSNLKSNLKAIRSRLRQGTAILPVVKANAYGHGLLQVAGILRQEGISRFAVAQPAEGLELRQAFSESEILVFGGWQANEAETFIEHRLTATVHDTRPVPPGLDVEVKIDTGMTRIGIPWESALLFSAPLLSPCKVSTHTLRGPRPTPTFPGCSWSAS